MTITNVNDSGAGSLRSALQSASSGQTLCFNIGGSGVHTITPGSQLPTITQSGLTIDGTSQPGYTNSPLIEIDGVNAGSGAVPGIYITGGNATIKGLAVTRFSGDGIIMPNNGSNTIQGNYVGLAPDGVTAKGNGHSGIGMQSSSNTIGGSVTAQRNVVSANGGTGIAITGSAISGNVVEGNYIGTNAAGTGAVGNGADGVLIDLSSNNTIGGTAGVTVGGDCTGACNLSSGNTSNGIGILGSTASGNTVAGNYAGTDVHGTSAIPNGDIGFEAQDAPSNTIGGTTPASRNLFSGNLGAGVSLTSTNSIGDVVEGNFVGVDVTGVRAMGNHKMGVNLGSPSGGSNNSSGDTIGGTSGTTPGGSCTGACNVISGNFWSGIYISGTTGGAHNIVGNFIGPGADGGTAIGNQQDGVGIVGSPNNHFGGPITSARNLISANGGNGIAVVGSSATGTRVEGNYIGEGTDAGCMPNHVDGVVDQVAVYTAIIGNNIFCSGFLGIDLGNDGVTANHYGGGSGANELQPYPTLSYAIPSGSNLAVAGTLSSAASTSFRLDFFSSPYCDASGHGQGRMFIGSGNVTTDGNGNNSFTLSLPSVGQGLAITSTATKIISNTPWETSEFSNCVFTPRQHPDGAIIQPLHSPNLFEVVGGQVEPIGSSAVLQSWGIMPAEFKTATTADTNLSGTSSYLYFREGTLLKGSAPDVYVVDETSPGSFVKRRITNLGAFNGLGYTAADIITVNDSTLPANNGSDITDASQHPDGTLMKDPNGPTVYWLEGGQKCLVGSPNVFVSQRFSSNRIKAATAADLALTGGANMYYREGALLKGSAPDVYVVDETSPGNFSKRRIGSVQAFVELQYTSAEVLNVVDSDLPTSNGPQI